MSDREFIAVDSESMPWEAYTTERVRQTLFQKILHTEPETGMTIALVRYPKGVINPKHTHRCGHALYVLEGRLVTHRGTFGSATFVWFPEGEAMEHGASAETDVVALFTTNKPFSIDYVDATNETNSKNV